MGNGDAEKPNLNEALPEGQEQQTPLESPATLAREKEAELAADIREDAEKQKRRERADLAREAEGEVGVDLDVDADTDTDADVDADASADAEVKKPEGPGLFDQISVLFANLSKGPKWDKEKGVIGNFGNIEWGGVWKAATASFGLMWNNSCKALKELPDKLWGSLWKKEKKKGKKKESDVEYDLSNADAPIAWPEGGSYSSDISESRTIIVDGEVGTGRHNGIDIGWPEGTPLKWALKGGKVLRSRQTPHSSAGYLVDVLHEGLVFRFLHLQVASSLKVGQILKKGDLIGLVGSTGKSTGPHLHFEARKHEKDSWPYGEPLDPYPFLSGSLQKKGMVKRKAAKAEKGIDPNWDVLPDDEPSALA